MSSTGVKSAFKNSLTGFSTVDLNSISTQVYKNKNDITMLNTEMTTANTNIALCSTLAGNNTFTGTTNTFNHDVVVNGNLTGTTITSINSNIALKAPLASPTFTGTVSGISSTMVGLGNCNNTTDLLKPISTATQTALNLLAPVASPTFTGTVSGINSTMVGLGNCTNTSDANKPVSTAQQTALNLKSDLISPSQTLVLYKSNYGITPPDVTTNSTYGAIGANYDYGNGQQSDLQFWNTSSANYAINNFPAMTWLCRGPVTASPVKLMMLDNRGILNVVGAIKASGATFTGPVTNTSSITSQNIINDGNYNTAFASNPVVNGSYNTQMGNTVAVAKTSGNYNSYFGFQSGYNTVSGNANTVCGAQAGGTLYTNSSYNTSIGYQCDLGENATVNYSTGLGASSNCAGYSYSTAIGYSATCTAANQVMLGTAAETVVCPNNLSVSSSITAGNVVTSTFNSSNFYASNNNTNYGAINNGGSNNVCVGPTGYTGFSGSYNTGIGHSNLPNLTTGNFNCAVGQQAGTNNSTGICNSYLGYLCSNNGDFSYSTAIGKQANITANNQIMLGTSGETVVCPNTLTVASTITSPTITTMSASILSQGSSIASLTTGVAACATLNGNNTFIGTNTFANTVNLTGATSTNGLGGLYSCMQNQYLYNTSATLNIGANQWARIIHTDLQSSNKIININDTTMPNGLIITLLQTSVAGAGSYTLTVNFPHNSFIELTSASIVSTVTFATCTSIGLLYNVNTGYWYMISH